MEFTVSLPDWAKEEVKKLTVIESLEERMREVIRFSRLNVEHDTGGPFAAGVFEEETGKLVSMGIRSLVIAGSDGQLEAITGFDEGPIHPQWKEQLEARGVVVQEDLLKDEAVEVFKLFRDSGKLVYNGRGGE